MAELELTAGTIEYEDTGGDGPGAGAARRAGDGRLGVGPVVDDLRARPSLRRPDAAAGRASQSRCDRDADLSLRGLRADGRRAARAPRPAAT